MGSVRPLLSKKGGRVAPAGVVLPIPRCRSASPLSGGKGNFEWIEDGIMVVTNKDDLRKVLV